MKKIIFFSLFVLICIPLTSYAESKIAKLPSGKEIKILGLTKMIFTKADPGLMLKYETKIDIENKKALRKEAEEIWPVFRVDVEKSGMDFAVISANSPPTKRYLIVEQRTTQNFKILKQKNGTWGFEEWGRDYKAEAEKLANIFLKSMHDGKFSEAVDTLYIPQSYSGKKLIDEKAGLGVIVAGVSKYLGSIKLIDSNKSFEKFHSVDLSTATEGFWKKHPYFNELLYDVNYSKEGDGIVIFLFSIINDKLVINSVRFGITDSNKKSAEILERVTKAVQNDLSHL